MKIGKIRSVKKLIDSEVLENQQLVLAIMKGPDVTSKQRVKYVEYLFTSQSFYSLSTEIYIQALTEFQNDILNYESRKHRNNSIKTIKF